MLTVAALQVGLPTVLIVLLFVFPPSSLVVYLVSVASIGMIGAALALAAMWIAVPWWTPYAQTFFLLLVVLAHKMRASSTVRSNLPVSCAGWLTLVFMLMLAVLSGVAIVKALQGRVPPLAGIVDVAPPLRGGPFLVVNGGSTLLVNPHMKTLDPAIERFKEWRGQSYAVDIVGTNLHGWTSETWAPTDPAAFAIFGKPVYAPCNGRVVSSRSNLPDMRVPDMDRANMLGNHVVLDCGEFWLVLAHFRSGTVSVIEGDLVSTGTVLGQVGNSGNTSMPHLHIHAQRPGSDDKLIAGEPLALSINRRFVVRNDRPSFNR